MSNLEHLIENGLCRLDEGKSYKKWREVMQKDCNWEGNENITIDNLWEICQYVICTWDSDKEEVVRCKDCRLHKMRGDMLLCKAEDKPHTYDWYCAGGERGEEHDGGHLSGEQRKGET